MGITSKRYKQVWSSLDGARERRARREDLSTGWRHRTKYANDLIAELEQDVAAINRKLVYVPNATICSLDDDQLRLSSKAVILLTSLRQASNPTKALGPVCNAVCSALTSFFIAGHYSRPKEKLLDTWVRLVQLIQGAPTKGSLAPMADPIFAADRGYNSAESINFVSNELGATCFGTHKRSLDYPFVFGDGPVRKKHKGLVVAEKGCRAIYAAKKKTRQGSSSKQLEASVYRESYSGRIAAVYSNNQRLFGALQFTLVPKDGFRVDLDQSKLRALQVLFERTHLSSPVDVENNGELELSRHKLEQLQQSVRHLTWFQSEDPCWFLLRAFRFTSRTAHAFVRVTAKSFDDNIRSLSSLLGGTRIEDIHMSENEDEVRRVLDSTWNRVLDCAGMRKEQAQPLGNTVGLKELVLGLADDGLKQMRKTDINEILAKLGRRQPPSVRKGDLINLLINIKEAVIDRTESIEEEMPLSEDEELQVKQENYLRELRMGSLNTWVIRPLVSTNGMKEGCLNEEEVLKELPGFLDSNGLVYKCTGDMRASDVLDLASFDGQSTLDNSTILQYAPGTKRRIDYIRSVGLISSKTDDMMGDSPDGICSFTDELGDCHCAAIEIKTMTSPTTIEAAKEIENSTSKAENFKDIGVLSTSNSLFRKLVPNAAYRSQCLHHAVVVGTDTVIYVVSKGGSSAIGEIIYSAF